MKATGSSLLMRVLPRTKYDFSGLQFNASMTIVVAQHIDASVFQEADLHVRLHGGSSIAGASSAITIGLVPDGYDFDDPAPVTATGGYADFLGPVPTRAGAAAVQVTSTTVYPFFAVVSMSPGTATPFGRLIAVTINASQGLLGMTTLIAVLSLDLVLKSGDARDMPAMPNGYLGYRII